MEPLKRLVTSAAARAGAALRAPVSSLGLFILAVAALPNLPACGVDERHLDEAGGTSNVSTDASDASSDRSSGSNGTGGGTGSGGSLGSGGSAGSGGSIGSGGGTGGGGGTGRDVGTDTIVRDGAPDQSVPQDGNAGSVDTGSPDRTADATPDRAVEAGAGDAPPGTITVSGHLIDYFRHPLGSVPVTIGASSTTTDTQGNFSIAGVTAPYDVSLLVSVNNPPNDAFVHGWVWKGLTRTDPTLQIYKGLPRHTATFNFDVNTTTDPATSPQPAPVGFALGSPDGEAHSELNNRSTTFLDVFPWRGPGTSTGTAHGLQWTRTGGFSSSRPVSFVGYAAVPFTSNETASASVIFDLRGQTVPTSTISGTVTSSTTTDRGNSLFVRFSDGATMVLVDQETNADTTFSYLVPTLPSASVTVAAQRSDIVFPPFAIAHQDGVVPGQTGIALAIPDPAMLMFPVAAATGINASTSFSWTGPSAVNVFRVDFDQGASSNSIFIVTQQTQTQLPTFPGTGFGIPAGATVTWTVETHGNYATVNDATGPAGMLDSASASGQPFGPRMNSGTYTQSEVRGFTAQ